MSVFLHRSGLLRPLASAELVGSMQFDASDEQLSIASFSSSSPNRRTFTTSIFVWQDAADDGWAILNAPVFQDAGSDNYYYNDFITQTYPSVIEVGGSTLSGDSFVCSDDGFPSGQWSHFVIRVDTTQATAANRIRVYRNNSQLTFDSETQPPQNYETEMFVNGRIAEVYLFIVGGTKIMRVADLIVVEGQSLAPTEFGYDNGGTWSWKNYTGSFGTYGFRLNPTGSGDLGVDSSGNGIDFTNSGVTFSTEIPPV